MADLRVIYLTGLGSLTGGGGNKRVYEMLKGVTKIKPGVEYIPVLDRRNLNLAIGSFPDLRIILNNLTWYCLSLRNEGSYLDFYSNIVKVSSEISRIAAEERVDLIVSAHESFDLIHIAHLSSYWSSRGWSAVLQLTPMLGTVYRASRSPIEALRGISGNYFLLLKNFLKMKSMVKVLEKTISLSVSLSIPYELSIFSRRLRIKALVPPLGVDEEVWKAKPLDSGFDAVFFARLHPLKGLYDIPLVWKEVVKDKPGAKLLVAGSWQSEKDKYRFFELIRRLGLESNIHYVGFLPKWKLYGYVKSAKVLIYPSYLDSFSLVVLESLACGTPVVAYDIPAIRLSYRTDSVLRVPVGDREMLSKKTVMLLEDEGLRKKYSSSGMEFASKYTWDSVVKEEARSLTKIAEYWSTK
ncbi:MAG: glycosyltransferase family 4 protein [Thermoproteota archaeon]